MAPYYLDGTGSPEGAVTAGVGSVYARTDATVGDVTWHKLKGSGSTGWELLQGDVGAVRPEEYGAVGDNTTDDTTAMKAALAAAISGKKRLLCTRKYAINDTLSVAGAVLIEGIGYESLVRQNGTGKNIFSLNSASGIINNVVIQNLRL
jgi:hypothetical protein